MIERILTLGDFLTINDVRRVVEVARDMDEDDELMLSVNAQESDKVSNIFSVLERNNFECSTKGGHEGRDYFIIARKKHL
jgi:hypothetical protein